MGYRVMTQLQGHPNVVQNDKMHNQRRHAMNM